MRYQRIILGIGFLAAFAVTSRAQDTAEKKKPGGLNKVAHNISAASKKAGSQVKNAVKSGSSDAHNVLTKAGNDTKAESKRVTGITTTHNDHPGGLNKVARKVSAVSKKTGADAKNSVKKGAADTHGALTKAGKTVKDTVLKKPPTPSGS